MELYLLRHGEQVKGAGLSHSSKVSNPNSGLTEIGRNEITRIAKSIKRFNTTFDVILTSPLNSAMQTAKIISNTFKMKYKIVICEELVPEGNKLKFTIGSTSFHQNRRYSWSAMSRISRI